MKISHQHCIEPRTGVPPVPRSRPIENKRPLPRHNFRSIRSTLLLALSALILPPALPAADLKLTGIADLNGRMVALLEGKDIASPMTGMMLMVGARTPTVEVLSINAKTGKASVKTGDQTTELSLGATDETDPPPTLQFNNAGSRQLLEFYQQLSGRTVLPSSSLPVARISLKSRPELGRNDSLEAVAGALREKGILVTPRSDKFAFATPVSQVPRLKQIPEPPPPDKGATENKDESFPPGLLKFVEADLPVVQDIYQELTGRTLLVSPELPAGRITLTTQTPLTRDEAVWLLEAAFFLAGTRMIPEQGKFTFALPATRDVTAPKIAANPAAEKLKAGKPGVMPVKLSQATSAQALALYADLLGRRPITEPAPPAARFTLRGQNALRPSEILYALDALAELNHLRFVLVGDKQVNLVRSSDAGKPAGNF